MLQDEGNWLPSLEDAFLDKALHEKLRTWRRHLHANPELSRNERETSGFVRDQLDKLGIPYVADVGGHGVVATLRRDGSVRSVGLRADMDALPILEANELPYRSTKANVMHACGHDGHTVSLLGAAIMLIEDPDWSGTVQLIFQPAEEGAGGAKAMIADGVLDRFPMERVFALHNWPGLEAGCIAIHQGPAMAEPGRFKVTLSGVAGHAAKPDLTRDPIVALGHLIVALQTIVSRNVDPLESAVVTIGQVYGGTAPNQIPTTAGVSGIYRTFEPSVRDKILQQIENIAEGVAQTFGMTANVEFTTGGKATVNTPAEVELAVAAAQACEAIIRRDMKPSMGAEDFAAFLQHLPGAYVWVGNGPVVNGGELHNDRYDFNDDILPVTSKWLAEVAKAALK